MSKLLIVLFFVLAVNTHAVAQNEISDLELLSAFSRISSTLKMSYDESQNDTSELELVESQRAQLAEIRANYVQQVKDYYDIVGNETVDVAISVLLEKYHQMEKRLLSEVLLPHQSELIQIKVFERLVGANGGNFITAIKKSYRDKFRFSEAQEEKLSEFEAKVQQRIKEAEARFKKELAEITQEASKELRGSLTPNQRKSLEQIQKKDVGAVED